VSSSRTQKSKWSFRKALAEALRKKSIYVKRDLIMEEFEKEMFEELDEQSKHEIKEKFHQKVKEALHTSNAFDMEEAQEIIRKEKHLLQLKNKKTLFQQ